MPILCNCRPSAWRTSWPEKFTVMLPGNTMSGLAEDGYLRLATTTETQRTQRGHGDKRVEASATRPRPGVLQCSSQFVPQLSPKPSYSTRTHGCPGRIRRQQGQPMPVPREGKEIR